MSAPDSPIIAVSHAVSDKRPSGWVLAIGGVIVALILQAIFIASYIGALHDPKPQAALPIGIVAPPEVVQQISNVARDVVDPRLTADEAALRAAIDDREMYGGLVFGEQAVTLIVADAASPAAAIVLTAFAQGVATARNLPFSVEHVHLLSEGDPSGQSLVYVVMGWVFGGYFCATVLVTLRGSDAPGRPQAAQRMGLLAVYAFFSGLIGATLVGPVIGAIDGHFLAITLAGTLLVFAVAATTMALQLLLGVVGTVVILIVFILLGNPSAGGIVPPEFLPDFWRIVGPWLPNSAGFELTRNLVYFDGHAVIRSIIVLAIYALAGAALLLFSAGRTETPDSHSGELGAELAAASAGAG